MKKIIIYICFFIGINAQLFSVNDKYHIESDDAHYSNKPTITKVYDSEEIADFFRSNNGDIAHSSKNHSSSAKDTAEYLTNINGGMIVGSMIGASLGRIFEELLVDQVDYSLTRFCLLLGMTVGVWKGYTDPKIVRRLTPYANLLLITTLVTTSLMNG